MGEDEPSGFLEGEQALFVLENQVIGIHIIGVNRLFPHSGIFQAFGLLINGEVPIVGVSRGNILQILAVSLIVDGQLRQVFIFQQLILFLKDAGVLAIIIFLVIVPILGHLVDKKQRKHLDALREQLLFPVQVRLDGFTDLNTADITF